MINITGIKLPVMAMAAITIKPLMLVTDKTVADHLLQLFEEKGSELNPYG